MTPLKWKSCGYGDAKSPDDIKCATLDVPYDYSNPTLGTFALHLEKYPAQDSTKRVGSMLVNPGGPGFGGSVLAQQAEYIWSQKVRNAFDIIGWDPRGTGESKPRIDCIDNYDDYFSYDPTPETDAEKKELVDASKRFADACIESNGDILQYISTANTARDVDSIRRALGEDKITFFGFSYGSELGGTWASMFPDTVRALVVDGAAEPNIDGMEHGLRQAAGFERQLDTFLSNCSTNKRCEFYNNGDAKGAFDKLVNSINTKAIPTTNGRTPVTESVFFTAVAQAMYSDSYWADLQVALHDAQNGDGNGILSLYDSYFGRQGDGTYDNSLEAFIAITCLDDPGPTTIDGVDAFNDDFQKIAPRIYPGFIGGYTCVFWPTKKAETIKITGIGAGPIVVIGTSGDAATPIEGTRKFADALEDGILIEVKGEQHTSYGTNECLDKQVDDYLVSLTVPTTLKCS